MSSKQPKVNKGSPVHSLKPENQSNYEEEDPLLTVRKHLNNRMANLQTKLTNIVFDEMEKQLDKIKPLNNDDINQITQIITNNSSQSMRTEADIRKPLNKQPEVYNKTLQDLIRVITKLPKSEQSYKGKVKIHRHINGQNQSTTGTL